MYARNERTILHSAPPRFRVEPLADYYVRLVDVIFAVTLTQTLVIYHNEIVAFSPPLLIETLVLVYLTVALSWVGYHRSIMKYPYNKSAWSGFRVILDIFILVVYAFLAFAAKEPPKVIMGLAAVFALYAIDGCARIAEWRDTKAQAVVVCHIRVFATVRLVVCPPGEVRPDHSRDRFRPSCGRFSSYSPVAWVSKAPCRRG
jgi:hypothetical protein